MVDKILCDTCKKEIKSKNDLILSSKYILINIKKYCLSCYPEHKKLSSFESLFIAKKPLNSNTSLIAIGIISLLSLGMIVFGLLNSGSSNIGIFIAGFFSVVFFILVVPFAIIRLYCYYTFEKPLE